jgi:toxin-antitoxin system PIN domain toxin
LIDINVWLALTWDLHPQHAAAERWYDSLEDATLLFCRFTMLGFLRLLTNRQVMGGSTVTLAGALDLYDRWRRDPRVDLASEPHSTDRHFREALSLHATEPAPKAVVNCYLVGFAAAAGEHLVTFDHALAATAQTCGVPVALLTPAGRIPVGARKQRSR